MKKYRRVMSHVTLKSDAKFKEKLILSSKNDIRNLLNFNASRDKSENQHFDVLLLSITYKVSAKKVHKIIFHDTEEWSKLWRKDQWAVQWKAWKFGLWWATFVGSM